MRNSYQFLALSQIHTRNHQKKIAITGTGRYFTVRTSLHFFSILCTLHQTENISTVIKTQIEITGRGRHFTLRGSYQFFALLFGQEIFNCHDSRRPVFEFFRKFQKN